MKKLTCTQEGHGQLHPVYYRDSAGRMIRAGTWHFCPACPQDENPFWDHCTHPEIRKAKEGEQP